MDKALVWIQGIAAVVQALVAVLLWWVTAKYVRLTHGLSKTAENQLALMRETEVHRRRADLIDLSSLTRRLLKSLEELPSAREAQDASTCLLFASLWRSEEIAEFRLLTAKAGQQFAENAEQPVVDLNWMLERINPVRSEARGQGFEMGSFRWDEYGIRLMRTKAVLGEIADKAAAVAQTLIGQIPNAMQ